jgi:hypothetical protein
MQYLQLKVESLLQMHLERRLFHMEKARQGPEVLHKQTPPAIQEAELLHNQTPPAIQEPELLHNQTPPTMHLLIVL